MIKKNISVNIVSSARLHLGFLDLGGNTKSSFGGIGVTINKFKTIINIKKLQNHVTNVHYRKFQEKKRNLGEDEDKKNLMKEYIGIFISSEQMGQRILSYGIVVT